MFFISNICILCLRTNKDLKTWLIKDNERIQNKINYCLPEIVDTRSKVPEYVCCECMNKIDYFYKFKHSCLRNNTHLHNYLQTLKCVGETHKHLSVKLSDIKYQNNPQVESHYQTLDVEDDDEIRTGGKEDNRTCEEADKVIKIEINLIDNEEAHSLSNDVIDIIVKEEGLIIEDNCNIEFHPEAVKSEPMSSDSDISISGNEDMHEESRYSSTRENISINAEETKDPGDLKIKKTKTLQCGFCDKDFSNKNLLEFHLKTHAGIKDFSCSTCGIECISEEELINHEKIHIDIANDCSTSKNNSNKELNSIPNDSDISENNQKILTNASNSSENIPTQPEQNIVTYQKKKKQYQCSICDKIFFYKASLEMHLKLHAGIKDYSCQKCGELFSYKRQLIEHEQRHTGTANFECLICNKKFVLKRHLIYHEKNHTGSLEFECSICPKKFLRKYLLQKHLSVHSDPRKYQCAICNRRFLRKNHLTTHEHIHTGLKEFECSVCGKKFRLKKRLVVHEQFHLGIKGYDCNICSQRFESKLDLNKHLISYHEILISV